MKTMMHEVDVNKFRVLVKKWGGYKAIGEKIYRDPNTIRNIENRERVSSSMAEALRKAYGVPIEFYEKKEDEIIEDISPVISLPETESDLKVITTLLREIANNQLALYRRVNHLTGIATRLEAEIIQIRKGERDEPDKQQLF